PGSGLPGIAAQCRPPPPPSPASGGGSKAVRVPPMPTSPWFSPTPACGGGPGWGPPEPAHAPPPRHRPTPLPMMSRMKPDDDLRILRNRTFDELAVGDTASIERTLAQQDIQLFAMLSGDFNPTHIDSDFAASTRHHGVIAHGMWGSMLITAVLGTTLPGPCPG